MRDPVFAAEEDALRVDVLNALPGVDLGLEHRIVVSRHDPGVVVEDVDAAVALRSGAEHLLDALGIGDVDPLEERFACLGSGLLPLILRDVGNADARSLL
jgi:hypothetical protein